MDISKLGSVVRTGDEFVYVFGKTSVAKSFGMDEHIIGVDLDSGSVVHYYASFLNTVELSQLSEKQQLTLAGLIPLRHRLASNVVTISGKARSGKDTVASAISESLGHAVIMPMAEPIYDIDHIVNGTSDIKNRPFLIMVGQGLREKDPHIWVKTWLRKALLKIQNAGSNPISFIVPDTRQPNEFTFFQSVGATSIKVLADEVKRINKIRELDGAEAADNEELLNDETESHSEGFSTDITLHNNYDQAFFSDITEVVEKLK